jgi:DNA replication protein DnaC
MMQRLDELLNRTDTGISKASTRTTSSTDPEDVCPICGGAGYLRRDLPPGHPEFGRPVPCQCVLEQISERRLDDLRKASNLGLLARMTFDNFRVQGQGLQPSQEQALREAHRRAREFAESPEGWLILLGGYGCGKTHLAAAIANYCIQRGHPCLFVVVPDLLDHLRAAYSPGSAVAYDERFEAILEAPLLILDDLGAQQATPWAQEKLYQLFNHRYNAGLPTVITSNRLLEEMDPRLRSRIADTELCQIYRMVSRDFRGSGHGDQLSSLHLYEDKTFDSFELRPELSKEDQHSLKQALAQAKEFASKPEKWLVVMGEHGCGKTHLAAAIGNFCLGNGQPVVFKEVPDLLDHLRATYRPGSPVTYDQLFETVRSAPLLILDDLGTESATPWAQEKLHQIFNYRYAARLPTVITMRKAIEEIDPHLASRMLDVSLCTTCAILGPGFHGSRGAKRGTRKRGKR